MQSMKTITNLWDQFYWNLMDKKNHCILMLLRVVRTWLANNVGETLVHRKREKTLKKIELKLIQRLTTLSAEVFQVNAWYNEALNSYLGRYYWVSKLFVSLHFLYLKGTEIKQLRPGKYIVILFQSSKFIGTGTASVGISLSRDFECVILRRISGVT